MNSIWVFTRFGTRGGISKDEFEKLIATRVIGRLEIFDSFVLRNLLSLLWLLSFDEGLLYKDNLPIFTDVQVDDREVLQAVPN